MNMNENMNVNEIEFGVSEVARLGISKIIKKAEEHGLVVITKKGEPMAMLVPLTIVGFKKYLQLFSDATENEEVPEEVRQFSRYVIQETRKIPELL